MALLGGGAILGLVSGHAAVELPLVGSVKPWQLVLIVSGALGLFVAVLMLTIREPKRTGLDNAAPVTIALAWRYLRDRGAFFYRWLAPFFPGRSLCSASRFGRRRCWDASGICRDRKSG
jgi:hypothetical protein